MMNQILYTVPWYLKSFARKLVVSIVERDIVHYNQRGSPLCRFRILAFSMEGLSPSNLYVLTVSSLVEFLNPSFILREVVFDIFGVCSWLIREFGWPRYGAYQRSPKEGMSTVSL
jgi:hypothetical protein